MVKVVSFDNKPVVMNVCRCCAVGSGITIYPDGVRFAHAQKALKDGLCDDCWAMVHRCGNGNGCQPVGARGTAPSKLPSRQ